MKKKKNIMYALTATLLILTINQSKGQTNSQNIKGNTSKLIQGIYVPDDDPLAKQLVLLALENADIKASQYQVEEAEEQLKLARSEWWNNIVLSGNINEYSINPPPKTGGYYPYYPRYNFGGSIPFGIFTTHAHKVRAAKKAVAIAEEQKILKMQQVKTEVLTAYQDYLMYKQQLSTENTLVENLYNVYLQAEQKFRNGQISIDEYNKALQSYNGELNNKATLQRDLNVSKLKIEELIGVPLENVLRAVDNIKDK